jgi:hypothetical protein
MKRFAAVVLAALAVSGSAFAQASLKKSSSLPKIDGVVGASEYQYSDTLNVGIKVFATLGSDDNLYLAVEAPTSGWVAAGVGGLVMNGSRLFLGAVQDGKSAFLEKSGVGHFYADAKQLVVEKWAVSSSGGDTVMELVIPSSAAAWKGQINTIWAYSNSPDFTVRHKVHASLSFTLQ